MRSRISFAVDHVFHAPAVGRADVHELDEAQDVAGALEMPRHGLDVLVGVTPRLTTMSTLTGVRPAFGGGVDGAEDLVDREVDVVHRTERRVVQRVEADRDAVEPRRLQGPRPLRRQQRAVGGHGDVVEAVDAGEHLDQLLEVAAQQGLAAGQAHLLDAEADEQTREARDLLEAQQLVARQEGVVAAEDLLRHAVGAAEVAAVRDRDAQVMQRPVERIEYGWFAVGHSVLSLSHEDEKRPLRPLRLGSGQAWSLRGVTVIITAP